MDLSILKSLMMLRNATLFTFILILTACQSASQAPATEASRTPVPENDSEQATTTAIPPLPSAEPLPSLTSAERDSPPTPQPSPTPLTQNYPLTHYEITADFDYDWNFISIDQTITYTNSSGEPIEELLLVVEPNRRYDTFRLKKLSWDNEQIIETYQLQLHRLIIPLPQVFQPGESIRLHISYDLNIPEIPAPSAVDRPLPFGYSARQTNLVDWYPFLPPYQPGQGWVVHNPWFYGEHQVYELADYDIEIRMTGIRQNVTLAASSPAEIEGRTYHYQMKSARSFALSASNMYSVFSQQVGDVTVFSYAFTFDEKGGQRVLKDTAAALELYSRLFGPYPHQTLSVVEADFMDGMEYDGLFFLSRGFYAIYDGSPLGYLTAIAVHETAHQWWYGMVGNNQALEPWLDEALCTYSELIYYENLYPDLVNGWWEFRVEYQQPVGWIDGSIYDYSGFVAYRDATYLRGAQFLHELRGLIGDEAFFSFLQDYFVRTKQQAHGLATADDFFDILSEHTNASLEDLLNAYFEDR
jgi:hypothetical protein